MSKQLVRKKAMQARAPGGELKEDDEGPLLGPLSWRHAAALLLLAAGWLEFDFLRPASASLGPLTVPLLTGISLIGPAVVLLFRFGKRTERLYLLGRALSLGAVVLLGAVVAPGTLVMMMGIGEPGPVEFAATVLLMIAVRVVLAGCLHAAMVAGPKAR